MHPLLSRRRFLEASVLGVGALLVAPPLSMNSFATRVSATPFFDYLQKHAPQKYGAPLTFGLPYEGKIRSIMGVHPEKPFQALQVQAGMFRGFFGELYASEGTHFSYTGPLPLPEWQHEAHTLLFNWVAFDQHPNGTVSKCYLGNYLLEGRPQYPLDAIPFP